MEKYFCIGILIFIYLIIILYKFSDIKTYSLNLSDIEDNSDFP